MGEDFVASNLSGCRSHDEDGLFHYLADAVHSDHICGSACVKPLGVRRSACCSLQPSK